LGAELAVDEVPLVHGRHLRHHDQALVALGGSHHGQPNPRVARGRLNDGGFARRDFAALLCRLDHRERDAIFDAAARVLHFELEQHFGAHGFLG
jgi:hypothetical protein